MAENAPKPSAPPVTRGELIGRFIVFQLKLAVDGIRDIILSPVSLVVLIAGLLEGGDRAQRHWNELMRLGHRTDLWINLFDHHAGLADAPGEGAMAEDRGRGD